VINRPKTWSEYMDSFTHEEIYRMALAEAASYGETGKQLLEWLRANPPVRS
jgi:hypothetical protein